MVLLLQINSKEDEVDMKLTLQRYFNDLRVYAKLRKIVQKNTATRLARIYEKVSYPLFYQGANAT